MHKCGKRGCQNQIEDHYRFCFEHKDTPYKDICKIHGKQTFINYQCQKCKELKKGIYRIYKRNKKYYFNKSKKPIDRNSKYYFLKPWFNILTHKTKKYWNKYSGNVSKQPGIYGIFVKDSSKKNNLGRCLYIGQSNSISRRIQQHKKELVKASHQIVGLKSYYNIKNFGDLKSVLKYKTSLKYYECMWLYNISNLKFATLYKINSKEWNALDIDEQKLLLTFLEQTAMDVYSPKLNKIAARPNEV